jgi:hypothetical protein
MADHACADAQTTREVLRLLAARHTAETGTDPVYLR